MTVCAYVHSGGTAALLSDLLVTSGLNHITPTNYGSVDPTGRLYATLTSKALVIQETGAIFGFSGSEGRIHEFLEYFPDYHRALADPQRPMKNASEMVNTFNEDVEDDDDKISVLGFQPVRSGSNLHYNIMSSHGRYSVLTEHFDECVAIGSGGNTVLKFIERYSKIIRRSAATRMEGLLNILYLAGALNSSKLFLEASDKLRDTWGGYIEVRAITGSGPVFTSPSWSHLRYEIDLASSEPVVTSSVKQFHFWPRQNRLMTKFRFDGSSVYHTGEWHIRSLFNLTAEGAGAAPWKDFAPSMVTICYAFKRGDREKAFHYTYSAQAVGHIQRRDDSWLELDKNFIEQELPKFRPLLPF